MVFTQRQGRPTFAATCDCFVITAANNFKSSKKPQKNQQLWDLFHFDFVVQKHIGSEFHM